MAGGIKYISKEYLLKDLEQKEPNLTVALCWKFKKRSYAISKDLQSAVARLDFLFMAN